MGLYIEYPCGECEWWEYDFFHNESYCDNSECPANIMEYH